MVPVTQVINRVLRNLSTQPLSSQGTEHDHLLWTRRASAGANCLQWFWNHTGDPTAVPDSDPIPIGSEGARRICSGEIGFERPTADNNLELESAWNDNHKKLNLN